MARGYPDYEGNKVGLYLIPEWAAKEGTDKSFYGFGTNVAVGDSAVVNYTVPAAKTLYISAAAFAASAYADANADLNQVAWFRIVDTTTGDVFVYIGGNSGGQITFPKPIVIPAAHQVSIRLFNQSNHTLNLRFTAQGYEV